MTRITATLIITAATVTALPGTALAQGEKVPGFAWDAETQLGYDDNVYRTTDQENSDGFFTLQPTLAWVGLYGPNHLVLSYEGDYGVYFSEDDLDYDIHRFAANALLEHTARLKTEYTAGHERGEDRPGDNDDLFLPGEKPDKWETNRIEGTIEYGNTDSTGQLVGRLSYNNREYTNNNQEFRDVDTTGATGTFYYRIAPRTRLLFEVDYYDYDYGNQDAFDANQGGDEISYLTGVTWEATAKTTGVFKIGYRERSYDDNRFDEESGLALFLDGTWQPNDYTTVTFGAARDNQDSAQQGTNGYVNTSAKAGLQRDITPRTRLTANLEYANEDFDGQFGREDDRWDFGIGVEYSLLTWLDIGAEYRFEDRDSDIDIYDFSANVFMLTATTNFQR